MPELSKRLYAERLERDKKLENFRAWQRAKAEKDADRAYQEKVRAEDLAFRQSQAKENLRNTQNIYARLQVAVSAMETRRSELDNLVKLYCAGYFSTPAVSNATKADVNEQTARTIRKNLNK